MKAPSADSHQCRARTDPAEVECGVLRVTFYCLLPRPGACSETNRRSDGFKRTAWLKSLKKVAPSIGVELSEMPSREQIRLIRDIVLGLNLTSVPLEE
jgi:hypothetical protein